MVIYNGNANGSGVLQSKIALDNRVHGGWPDIVFSEENNDAASLASPQFNYPAVLSNGTVSKPILNGYAAGTLAGCTVNGKVYCLRNDLAQNLLFYNSALMTQFGYTVPTTWQGWQTLGEQVATQHPGYIVGSVGDNWDDDIYLWPSECHVNGEDRHH
jgi:multiple sugar transport system substrate-binding protein